MSDHETARSKRKLILSRQTVHRLDPVSVSLIGPAASNNQTQQGPGCNWPFPANSAPTQVGPNCAPADPSPEQPAREKDPTPPR